MLKEYYTGKPRLKEMTDPVNLPRSTRRRRDDPLGYRPDPGLVEAANVALILGSPLLLTGDPGVGKTSFAASLANELNLGEPLRFETKSTSVARDLFYVFDTLGRFKSKETGENNLDFIFWQALGEAIIQSQEREAVRHLLNNSIEHKGPKRSVVLIDEIDKAPRDFPNDLLNEIDKRVFRVPELGNREIPANEELMPILVLTSNSETNLPEAFLRRCVYYHIPFPERDVLRDIVATRIGVSNPVSDEMVSDAIDLFGLLREDQAGLSKRPSIAELIEWLYVLPTVGAVRGSTLIDHPEVIRGTLSVLVKTSDDRERALAVVNDWLKPTPR